MIDLEEIKRHRARWTPDDGTSPPTICEHVDALGAAAERLQHDIADFQMLRDEHQMDVMHAFQEGGSTRAAKVIAWLQRMVRNTRHWGREENERAEIYDRLVNVFECGEHCHEEEE